MELAINIVPHETFIQFLNERKETKLVELFFDIETFQFNQKDGRKKPTDYKNGIYSLAISYFYNNETLHVVTFPNFKTFFDMVLSVYINPKTNNRYKKIPSISLNAHNTNRYDNHFLRKEIVYHYPFLKIYNQYLKNAVSNHDATRKKDLSTFEKKYYLFEKRVKSSINLDMEFCLNGVQFFTIDNYMKTHTSIATLGKKLLHANLLNEEFLKTDFDYYKYNLDENLTMKQAISYGENIYNQLSDEELIYIYNDVIILAFSVFYYSIIFPNFDYGKITFTSNILDVYNKNNYTSFHLLNAIKTTTKKQSIQYTDYSFHGQNYYDYLKSFYKGGSNFYNYSFLGQNITSGVFAIDINSSYPFVMYQEKIPLYIVDFAEYKKATAIPIDTDNRDYFTIFRMDLRQANLLIQKLESDLLKKIIIKYYNDVTGTVNLNTNLLRLIEQFTNTKITTIKVLSYNTFKCEHFGARDTIAHYYQVKSQAKEEKELIMTTPFDYHFTEKDNTPLSKSEIDLSKTVLNGLYGIPALRSHFNLFRRHETGEYTNAINGFKNSERNILFSIFVTSQAFYNLLFPLTFLTQKEIDENLLYGDTDSLYLKSEIKHKIPTHLFDEIALGKWSYDCEDITEFYALNHKKYCYYNNTKKKIIVKCGGIPQNAFNFNYPNLSSFIENEFHESKTIKNTRGIYNNDETISIYVSQATIDKGKPYFSTYSPIKERVIKNLRVQIQEEEKFEFEEGYYYSTDFGDFGVRDIFPVKQEITNLGLQDLLEKQHRFLQYYIRR